MTNGSILVFVLGAEHLRSLFIFRRDLRIEDNTALIAAVRSSKAVATCFILDPRQRNHPYFSQFGAHFLRQSLDDLAKQLRDHGGTLHVLEGVAEEVVAELLRLQKIDAVYCNRDYTPFSMRRDSAIEAACKKSGAAFHCMTDALLHEPEEVHKADGAAYTVFTPFFNKAASLPLRGSTPFPRATFFTLDVPQADYAVLSAFGVQQCVPTGGRTSAIALLQQLGSHAHYKAVRDMPGNESGTTHLSAHLKFGTCSVREAHQAICARLGDTHPLLRQLYWRDFFTHVAHHFPHVFQGAFHRQYDSIAWSTDEKQFNAWCNGTTGFPIVDAGMRQLNQTGFMHNRVRMIAASFLVKDLHQDWRNGERYFATKLTDYDPAVNNGNWQWSASTGCDAAPYFRIFNPWLQQLKFDPQCQYVLRWVPELQNVPVADIHAWNKAHVRHGACKYPSPIVDHSTQAARAKLLYQSVR